MNNSLENVKVGDYIYVSNGMTSGIECVERITATLVITKCRRFSKKDGLSRCSDMWSRWTARPATQAAIAEQIYKKYVRQCENIDFKKLSNVFNNVQDLIMPTGLMKLAIKL